eukprot:COSAG02_NODE_346_length_24113_cov_13.213001_22_plen_76_part_00
MARYAPSSLLLGGVDDRYSSHVLSWYGGYPPKLKWIHRCTMPPAMGPPLVGAHKVPLSNGMTVQLQKSLPMVLHV